MCKKQSFWWFPYYGINKWFLIILYNKKGIENKRWFSDILKRKEGAKPWKKEKA